MKYNSTFKVKIQAPNNGTTVLDETNAKARFTVFDVAKRSKVTSDAAGQVLGSQGRYTGYDVIPVADASMFAVGNRVELQMDSKYAATYRSVPFPGPPTPNVTTVLATKIPEQDAGRAICVVNAVDTSAKTITIEPYLAKPPIVGSLVKRVYGIGSGGLGTLDRVAMRVVGTPTRLTNWWWEGTFNPREYGEIVPGTNIEIETHVARTLGSFNRPNLMLCGDSITNNSVTEDDHVGGYGEGGYAEQVYFSDRLGSPRLRDDSYGWPQLDLGLGINGSKASDWIVPTTGHFAVLIEPLTLPLDPVVIMLGSNDCTIDFADAFEANMRVLVDLFIAKGATEIFLMSPPDWLGASGAIRNKLNSYRPRIKAIYEDTTEVVGMVDLFPLLTNANLYQAGGGVHPNEAGHTIILEALSHMIFNYYNPSENSYVQVANDTMVLS